MEAAAAVAVEVGVAAVVEAELALLALLALLAFLLAAELCRHCPLQPLCDSSCVLVRKRACLTRTC